MTLTEIIIILKTKVLRIRSYDMDISTYNIAIPPKLRLKRLVCCMTLVKLHMVFEVTTSTTLMQDSFLTSRHGFEDLSSLFLDSWVGHRGSLGYELKDIYHCESHEGFSFDKVCKNSFRFQCWNKIHLYFLDQIYRVNPSDSAISDTYKNPSKNLKGYMFLQTLLLPSFNAWQMASI